MATSEATITIAAKDLASQDLKKILELLKATVEEKRKDTAATSTATEETGKWGQSQVMAGAAVAGVTVALVAAGAAIKRSVELMLEATQVADRYQFAEAQVDAALRRTAKDTDEAARMKARLMSVSARLATQTGVEVTQVQIATARYVAMGKSVDEAGRLASLAMDISARKGIEFADAAQKVAEVTRSNTGSFAELADATKGEEEALDAMTSKTAKSERMLKLLEERFGGAKSEIQGTQVAVNNLTNAKAGLVAEIGKLIDESGVVDLVLRPVTDVLGQMALEVKNNKKQYLDLALVMADKVVGAGEFIAKSLVVVVTAARTLGVGLEMLAVTSKIAWNNILQSVGTVQLALKELFVSMLSGFDTALEKMESLASSLGQDTLASGLRDARGALQGLIATEQAGAKARKSANAELGKNTSDYVNQLDSLGITQQRIMKQGADAWTAVDSASAKASANIEARRKKLAATQETAPNQDLKGARKEQDKLAAEGAARDAKKESALAAQVEVLRLQTKLLTTVNQQERVNLEYQIKIAQAKANAASIENAELATATLKKEQKEAELQRERALLDLQTQRGERAREQFVAELERQALLRKEREAAVQETVDGIMRVAESFDVLGSSSNQSIALAGKGLKSLTGAIGALYKANLNNNKQTAEGAKLTAGAYASIGEGVASLAGSMGASAILQAAILAPFNLAAGLAASANPATAPQAPMYYAAAAQYAVVAGMSAAGVGGGGGGGGGIGGTGLRDGAPSGPLSASDAAKESAEIFAEVFAEKTGGRNQSITIDLRNSIVASSGEQLYEEVRRSARTAGVDLDRRG